MVVDAVIQHWVILVGGWGGDEGTGQVLGASIQALVALFNAGDELFASLESACLQGAFDTLTGLFDRVGLQTNEGKTIIMACRPCHTPMHG